MKKRILIVDDHPVVRKGLKQILEETDDIIFIDEAARGLEVVKKVKNTSSKKESKQLDPSPNKSEFKFCFFCHIFLQIKHKQS